MNTLPTSKRWGFYKPSQAHVQLLSNADQRQTLVVVSDSFQFTVATLEDNLMLCITIDLGSISIFSDLLSKAPMAKQHCWDLVVSSSQFTQ